MTITSTSSTASIALQLHVAALHARLFATEVDSIGTALCGGFTDAEGAIAWAADIGLDIVAASSAAA